MSGEEPKSKRMKQSPAWDFLGKFVRPEEAQAVQNALEDAKMQSLEDLKAGGYPQVKAVISAGPKSELDNLFTTGFDGKLADAIRNQSMESLLNQKEFNFGAAGLPSHEVNSDVQSTDNLFTTREGSPPPILVLGSSGSGKTTFAAKVLPSRLRDLSIEMFTVYLTADAIRPQQGGESGDGAKVTNAAKIAVQNIIQAGIGNNIGEDPELDILMVVIIDEVGLERDSEWMGSKSKLAALTTKLQNIAKRVQLVLAGTGLDRVSSEVNSDQDCVKIRMKPWENKAIEWWAKTCLQKIESSQREEIFRFVLRTPILKALTTNARATRFLLEALEKYDEYFDEKALIDHVVTTVAFMYIKSNGLKDLETKGRRRVAKLVLKALSGSKKGETETFPPNLGSEDDRVQRACLSLVETNVEKNKLMRGHDYAVSASPAITIVLTALMGCISTLSSSWSGFERIVALSELQRCFVDSDKDSPPRLIRSKLSFPPTHFRKIIKVPNLENTTVVVNGRGAPYADVVGNKRLIQCKHTITKGTTKTLLLHDELKKLGVLKDEHYKDDDFIQNRFLTNRLIAEWNNDGDACSETEPDTTDPAPTGCEDNGHIPDGLTRSMYPMGQLDFNEEPDEIGFVEYEFKDGEFYRNGSQTPIEWDRTRFAQDITVVFSTNKNGFKLKLNTEEEIEYAVARQHLEDDGQIKSETAGHSMNNVILEYLEKQVDTEKVKIRFQVCTH